MFFTAAALASMLLTTTYAAWSSSQTEDQSTLNLGIEGNPSAKYQVVQSGVLVNYTGLVGEVTILPSVNKIANQAFMNNVIVTQIVIPASVNEISAYAFMNMVNLKKVVILGNISSLTLGAGLFMGCENLTSVVGPDGVTSVVSQIKTKSPQAFVGTPLE
jgi:hypothetical protein